ncbi:MAG TPA: trypsin-like peptidase domain-containing protein [Homoserinimonas sp.]|nr:trypsin-like peptidase domain-containing protein [Homoserinimonas sp.]
MSDNIPSQPKPESETPGTDPSTQPETPSTDLSTEPETPNTEPSNPSAPEPTTPTTPSPSPGEPPAPPAPPVPPTGSEPAGSTQATPKAEKRNGNVGVIAALAVGALIGGVSGAGVTAIALNSGDGQNTSLSPSETNITVNDPGNATTITAVAASAAQSVVTISVRGEGASGSGSGVFLSEDGYLLTNAHVATLSGATADPTISVQTSDGHLYGATLVGSDPIADLAVVKVDADGVEFQPADFADSDKLNVGDTVVALGAPLGLPNTVTSGIVSALNRSITVSSSAVPEETEDTAPPREDDGTSPFDFWEFDDDDAERPAPTATIALPVIQTDAAINPGNSGGALLDSDGKVIGINVAIASAGGSQQASGNIGLGFAIPSNLAERVAAELIEDGTASHGLLGASVLSVSDDEKASTTSATVGSVIKEVTPGGAADAAGLQPGDIVTEFNGLPITSSTDLTAQVRVLPGGADAELVYLRDGEAETVTVTLGEL